MPLRGHYGCPLRGDPGAPPSMTRRSGAGGEQWHGVGRQISAFGRILTKEPICVLVSASLPRALGITEVDLGTGVDAEADVRRHAQLRNPAGLDWRNSAVENGGFGVQAIVGPNSSAQPGRCWYHSRPRFAGRSCPETQALYNLSGRQ